MDKREFLARLRKGLAGLPAEDREERLSFYSEMIDDRMEDGLPEEEAVEEIGPVEEIISQIIAETPLTRLVKEKIRPRGAPRTWVIVLLALGFPLWFSLLIAVFAVAVSLYAALWAVILSLWAVLLALAVSAFAGAAMGLAEVCRGEKLTGMALIGTGFICAGLSIYLFFGCRAASRFAAVLARDLVLGLKRSFFNKEVAE